MEDFPSFTARSPDHNSWWSGRPHHHSGSRTRDSGWTHHTRHPSGFKTSTVVIPQTSSITVPEHTITSILSIGVSDGNIVTEIVPWWSTIQPPSLATPSQASRITESSHSVLSTQTPIPIQANTRVSSQISTIPALKTGSSADYPSIPEPSTLSQPLQLQPPFSTSRYQNQFLSGNPDHTSSITPSPISSTQLIKSTNPPRPATSYLTPSLSSPITTQTNHPLPPPHSSSPPRPPASKSNHPLPTTTKIALALGILLFLFLLLGLALLCLRRYRTRLLGKRRYRSIPSHSSPPSPAASPSPIIPSQPISSPTNQISSIPALQTQKIEISNAKPEMNEIKAKIEKGKVNKTGVPQIVKIIAGEGRGEMDRYGVRWPERVVLRGEAREVWEFGGVYRDFGRGGREGGWL